MHAVSDFLLLFELCTVLDRSVLDLDLDTSFINNGGDSLRAMALVAACKSHGLQLPRDQILKGQTLRRVVANVSGAASPRPADFRNYLSTHLEHDTSSHSDTETVSSRDPVTPDRSESPSGEQKTYSPTTGYDGDSILDHMDVGSALLSPKPSKAQLTELQLHFIHGSLKKPGANFIVHSEIYETNAIPSLKKAWKKVIESEPIFNQDFPEHDTINTSLRGFNWSDSRFEDIESKSEALQAVASFFRVTPVDGSSNATMSMLTWTVHHSLIDGYSASIMFNKVRRLIHGNFAVSAGPSFRLFTEELESFRSTRKELGNAYWASQEATLSTSRHDLLLPTAHPDANYAGSSSIAIDISAIKQRIQAKAKHANITPAALFYAAWAMTLSSFTNSEVVSFGAVLCGRNLPVTGALDVIGPVLNVLPFSISLIGSMTSMEFLQMTFHRLIELEEYQWTTPDHGFCRSFESALSVEAYLPDSHEMSVQPLARTTRQEHEVPLGLTIDPAREVGFHYHVNRFSEKDMQRLSETYRLILDLLLDSDRTVDDICRRSMPKSHKETLEKFGNFSPSSLTQSIQEDLVTLFEQRARDIPNHIALEKGCDKMSYDQMDRHASKIAARLGSHIKKGEIVCIYSDRSLLWLCAVFGILKAGGVYCSMDPAEPQELRNRKFVLSGARVFLTVTADQSQIVPEACTTTFTVQNILESPEYTGWKHRQTAKPNSPAYVCFTSGSTGTPKGVLCAHAGLVAFQSSLDVRLFAAPGRRIAHIMSVAFDGSIHEIFSALTHGATLVLPFGSDPFGHLHSVDAAILTPSLARLLDPHEFKNLRWVRLFRI
jgi:non-ribosomal peptide synthetase component F/aryl carrier-like protein